MKKHTQLKLIKGISGTGSSNISSPCMHNRLAWPQRRRHATERRSQHVYSPCHCRNAAAGPHDRRGAFGGRRPEQSAQSRERAGKENRVNLSVQNALLFS